MKRKEPGFRYNYSMLLDDDGLDNFINKKTLEITRFTRNIYVNSSSQSALESLNNIKISNSKNSNVFPGIIFIDITMPIVDGFNFIEKFKITYPEKINSTKLVILTSSIDEKDREKAMSISNQIIFLNKPLTLEALDQL